MAVYTERRAETFLRRYLPIAPSILTKDMKQTLRFSRTYPKVLKLSSSELVHKSDVGGVVIVGNEKELYKAFLSLTNLAHRKKISYDGILVQEYVDGHQLIIGIKRDETFKQTILLGMGGIFVEVLQDIEIRICPISLDDAREMIRSLKAFSLLQGIRGGKGINFEILENTLLSVSRIALKYNIKELDINPFIINEKEGYVVDARIVF